MSEMIENYHIRDEEIELNRLTLNPKNPRLHPDNLIESLKKSITKFGKVVPIVVDENYMILAGHARYKAARSLGLSTFPVRVFKFTPQLAELFMLADNKIAELSEWDDQMLAELFEELEYVAAPLEVTGFDSSEIKEILNELDSIICGDTLTVLKEMPAESIDCCITSPPSVRDTHSLKMFARIIQRPNIIAHILSKCKLFRTKTRTVAIMAKFSFILLSAKFKQYFSLSFLNPQIRDNSSYKFYCLFVGKLQRVKWLAVLSSRFFNPVITTKKRMYQLSGGILNLFNPYALLISRGSNTIYMITCSPRITLNSKVAVGVHNTRDVSKNLWFHNITLTDKVYNNHHSGG